MSWHVASPPLRSIPILQKTSAGHEDWQVREHTTYRTHVGCSASMRASSPLRPLRLSEELLNSGDAFGLDQVGVKSCVEAGGAQSGIAIGGKREEAQFCVVFA